MLYETTTQPQIFLFLALAGFASGFLFDIGAYIVFLCKHNKIVKIILDFLLSLMAFAIFYWLVLILDYGELRLYHFFDFWAFLAIERKTLGKIIAKFIDWCYNLFTNLMQKLLKGLQKKNGTPSHTTDKTD